MPRGQSQGICGLKPLHNGKGEGRGQQAKRAQEIKKQKPVTKKKK